MAPTESKTTDSFHKTFDDIKGLDLVSFYINDEEVVGYFETSPIEPRIIKLLGFIPAADNTQKPYRAHWMVSDSKLYLGYVNGIVNGKRFFTTDVVPDFPDDEVLHFYSEFSGQVKLIVQQMVIPDCFIPYLDDRGEHLMLSFERGVHVKV